VSTALANLQASRWTERIAALGLTLLRIDALGRVRVSRTSAPGLGRLLSSASVTAALRPQLSVLDDPAVATVTLFPGAVLVSLGHDPDLKLPPGTREAVLLLTQELVTAEQLRRACDEQELDWEATVAQLRPTLLPAPEADRLARCVHWMRQDGHIMVRQTEELGSLGSELADNYEELTLLYKLSSSMTLDQPTDLFLQGACSELQEVSGLEWLALWIGDGAERLAEPQRNRLYTAGVRKPRTHLEQLGRVLADRYGRDPEPIILDDPAPLLSMSPSLSRDLLIVPLYRDGQTLGVLFGGERLDAAHLDSNDAKLCDSLSNSLAIFLENLMLLGDAQSLFIGTLHALTSAIDAKDSYTFGHSERVALVSKMLAEAVGLEPPIVERVYLAGLIHDVGKIGVPERVLCKPGRLTDDEFGLIKQHPQIGANIVRDIRQMNDLVPGVLHHHERWDGRGYPHGLSGTEIPLFGRLLGLADAFDAMSSTRTYRCALQHGQVLQEIRDCRGAQFDPDLADRFLGLDFTPFFDLIEQHRVQRPAEATDGQT
jgi:HD-GYP domain-containing protein (c-di-GMP phosphodiesterase class II)